MALSSVGVVVGNPKARSRTLTVARAVAGGAAAACGLDTTDAVEVDLSAPLLRASTGAG